MLVLDPQSGNSSGTSLGVRSVALLQVAKQTRYWQVKTNKVLASENKQSIVNKKARSICIKKGVSVF